MNRILTIVLVAGSVLPGLEAAGQALNGRIDVESRSFPRAPLLQGQPRTSGSLAFQPELFVQWAGGGHRVHVEPFVRLDASDQARTHWDLRELYWQRLGYDWELKIGVSRVFWGVTESQHLVDIINQTDLVEGPRGEARLGQPMVQLTVFRKWGTIDLFALPLFRERTFPGTDGRLRLPLEIDADQAGSSARPDLAIRWSHTLGAVDLAVSHFYGRNREPDFALAEGGHGPPVLVPSYSVMNQSGLELQVTRGGFLWKLEARARRAHGDWAGAFVGGVEYTFGDVGGSGADVGLLMEYHYDSREPVDLASMLSVIALSPEERASLGEATRPVSLTPFNDDLFAGVRLALNDVRSTSLLAGALVDRMNGTTSVSAEAQRRIGEKWTLGVEVYAFVYTAESDPLHAMRRDSYGQVVLSRFF